MHMCQSLGGLFHWYRSELPILNIINMWCASAFSYFFGYVACLCFFLFIVDKWCVCTLLMEICGVLMIVDSY